MDESATHVGSGKVRELYALDADRLLLVASDRISTFDVVLPTDIPDKGRVLTGLSGFWFTQTAGIVRNHLIHLRPDGRSTECKRLAMLPIECVVRGYITGVTSTSLWQQYADGAREIYGHRFPDGLLKNPELPAALVTPTTKGTEGVHDVPLTVAEVAQRDLVEHRRWGEVVEAALLLFRRGQQKAAEAGLILADTKYEFGTAADGSLLLIDEMHTPDSSRYWVAASYEQRLAAGDEPESLDKEVVRRALLAAGYRGDGEPPTLPDDVWAETTRRYIHAFERLTGTTFEPGAYPVPPRIQEQLRDVSL